MTSESISNNLVEGNEHIQPDEQPQETNAQVSTQLPEASSKQPEIRVITEETKQQQPELVKNAAESSREETAEMSAETISNILEEGNEQI